MNRFGTFLLATAAFASISLPSAHAADAQIFSGVQASGRGNYFGQVGLVLPFWNQQLGNGFVHRYIVNALTYDYKKGASRIDGESYGGEAALGYQTSNSSGAWGGAYVGVMYQNTELSPMDPDSNAEGSHIGTRFQVEGEMPVAQNFKVGGIASYLTTNDAYWTRARVMYRVWDNIFAGPQAIFSGDSDYNARELGLAVTGFKMTPNSEIGFNAGARKSTDDSAAFTAGVEFSIQF